MNLSEARSTARSPRPALELISLAKMPPELARRNLRVLLMANPDHFGKITDDSFKAVLRIQQDTAYESIGYVAYSPRLEQLQATININQCTGYSDSCGGFNSREYVRFYLSYDDSTWLDQGMCAIDAYNVPGPKPLQQTVTVGIGPALTFCFLKKLPSMRAILSWNSPPPPDTPHWTPVWGDVLSGQVEFDELNPIPLHPQAGNSNARPHSSARPIEPALLVPACFHASGLSRPLERKLGFQAG